MVVEPEQRKRILIVEDSQIVRLKVKNILSASNFEVMELTNAEGIFSLFGSTNPLDLVILDLNLPGMDGLAALEKMRHTPGLDLVPVMVLTGDQKRATVQKALCLGAVDYIIKPFTAENLLKRVFGILGPQVPVRHVISKDYEEMYAGLRQDINRAKRGSSDLSVLVVHKRNFGRREDLAVELKSILREIDSLFILNDSTLLLLLPYTDAAGTGIVKSKLDEFFASTTPSKGRHQTYTASYPQHGDTAEQLLEYLREQSKLDLY